MFNRVLVVCEGNLCRSPVGAALLERQVPECRVESAGLSARPGEEMDPVAREVAEANGLEVGPHASRLVTRELVRATELLLVMAAPQREHLHAAMPEFSGKTMLFGKWMDERDIPDPYRKNREVHEQVFRLLEQASRGWSAKLRKTSG